MPNIAVVLKEEISRLARKEIRGQTGTLQKASAQYRRDIAELKRRVSGLQQKVALLERQLLKDKPAQPAVDSTRIRVTAKGIRSQRTRLGITAAELGKLVDVSPQTVYNWEREVARPSRQQLPLLAAIRGMGKKEAQARLEQLGNETGKDGGKN